MTGQEGFLHSELFILVDSQNVFAGCMTNGQRSSPKINFRHKIIKTRIIHMRIIIAVIFYLLSLTVFSKQYVCYCILFR